MSSSPAGGGLPVERRFPTGGADRGRFGASRRSIRPRWPSRPSGWMAPTGNLFHDYQIAFSGGVVGSTTLDEGARRSGHHHHALSARGRSARELDPRPRRSAVRAQRRFPRRIARRATFASLIAIEGDAVRTQQAYEASMSPIEQAQDLAEQLTLGSGPGLLSRCPWPCCRSPRRPI